MSQRSRAGPGGGFRLPPTLTYSPDDLSAIRLGDIRAGKDSARQATVEANAWGGEMGIPPRWVPAAKPCHPEGQGPLAGPEDNGRDDSHRDFCLNRLADETAA
jgi:hypothetical protein